MIFHNPRGRLIPDPGRFNLPDGSRIVFGTDGDDTFILDGPLTGGPTMVFCALGGEDVFNSALNRKGDRYYSGYLREPEWSMIGNGKPLRADLDKPGFTHIGEGDHAKGINDAVTHGGHYDVAASIWVGPPGMNIYVPGREIVDSWHIGKARPDFDGHGYTAPLGSMRFHNDTPDNPITDEQKIHIVATDAGHDNGWRPTWLDFSSPDGPTPREAQYFLDHWAVVV